MLKKGTPKPTWTSLVRDFLHHLDDFASIGMMVESIPGLSRNRAMATVHHLRKYRVIDSVDGGDGRLWWYVTGVDTRTYMVDKRVPEDEPRKRAGRRRTAKAKVIAKATGGAA